MSDFNINVDYAKRVAVARRIDPIKVEEAIAENVADRDALFIALKDVGLSLVEIGKCVDPHVSRQRVQQVVGSTPRALKLKLDTERFKEVQNEIWKRAGQSAEYWAGRGRMNRDKVIGDLIELTKCTKSEASILARDINIAKAAIFLIVGMNIKPEDHAKWIQERIEAGESQTAIWQYVNQTLPEVDLSQMAWCRYQNNVLEETVAAAA